MAQSNATGGPAFPPTMSVPDAGKRFFNIGRNASYAAAAAGTIPTIRVGRLLRVPVAVMERIVSANSPLSSEAA
jgi:hypothetical protein